MRFLPLLFFIFSLTLSAREVPRLDTLTLRNGLKIYLLHYGQDSVLSMRLWINGGKKNEMPCQVGYNEIIQLLLKETLREKQKSILKKRHKIKCEVLDGKMLLSATCTQRDFNRQMEILGTSLVKLRFREDLTNKALSTLIDTYSPESIHTTRVSEVFKNLLLYGINKPLGRDYCQYQVQKVNPPELREFYFQQYKPKNASLIICGNFNTEEIKKIISRQFSKWRTLRKEEMITDEEDLKISKIKNKEIIFINKRDAKRYELKWFQVAPSSRGADHPVFLIACDLFNRYLQKKIKENINGDSLTFLPVSCSGNFTEINCTAGNITTAINLFDTLLAGFHRLKFTGSEIDQSVKTLKDHILKTTSPENILAFYDPVLYSFSSRLNYPGDLSRVTAAELRAILEDYFDPLAYKLIIIGKEDPVVNRVLLKKKIKKYQSTDFQACDETCVPKKERWKSHSEQPRLFCRNCWKLGRFWGKNRS